MKREFHFEGEGSHKFWTIELVGDACVTTYGRVGTTPRQTRKAHPDAETALRDFDRQIAAKLAKGYVEGAAGAPASPAKTDWRSLSMEEAVFWRIIGLFNWKRTGDDDAVIAPAVRALAQMGEADIAAFEDLLAEKLFALDTEAHAREIGSDAYQPGRHFSVDEFLYARCVVVANGPDYYSRVLADPRQMPKDMEFEALLGVAAQAYERKAGREWEHVSPVSYETFSNSAGWSHASG